VADKLGISKATVYHYAKQGKIIKIKDPHRLIREARYKVEEVDALALERANNKPTGLRPSELAKLLDVPVGRIYSIIKDKELPVDEIPLGDEMKGYSISEEMVALIRMEVERTTPKRGNRVEFYESKYDISLFQLFRAPDGQELRAVRNQEQEWGFYTQFRTWISYADAMNVFKYEAAYPIHQPIMRVKGYTDFLLPKGLHESYVLLDFVYQIAGIENIRIRELDSDIALSIKSGEYELAIPVPGTLSEDLVTSFLALGDVVQEEGKWELISGYRRTTFDLPNNLLSALQDSAKEKELSMSEFVEEAIREKLERG